MNGMETQERTVPQIELRGLSKVYQIPGGEVQALNNINLTIEQGDIYGIIGMSGAGKSTLIRCLNRLDTPTDGQVLIDGQNILAMSKKQLLQTRRRMAMIFQQFNLLMQRTCLRNIMFPMELAKVPKEKAEARARELLELVGLPDKAEAYPAQLSGGQKQRIAIARALATQPKVLLCDEATSALDPNTTHSILTLIKDINRKLGITVVVITHQMSVVQEICDRVAILENGEVVEEGTVVSVFSNPKAAATRRLVFPDSAEDELDLPHDEHRLRVIFNGAPAANTPLIARMAMDKRIAANILYASTRSVGDKIYGHMLLGIPGGDEETRTAMEYLRAAENVVVEEA